MVSLVYCKLGNIIKETEIRRINISGLCSNTASVGKVLNASTANRVVHTERCFHSCGQRMERRGVATCIKKWVRHLAQHELRDNAARTMLSATLVSVFLTAICQGLPCPRVLTPSVVDRDSEKMY